jgi:tryptophan synthase alpha chain
VIKAASAAAVEVILLVAPTTPKERIQAIADRAQGFIYLVSVTGVTGMRNQLENRVQLLLTDLHGISDKPIGVGFGISEPSQAKQVMDWGADAVIVGSAFVKRLAEGAPSQGLEAIESFCRSLKMALSD